MIMVLDALREFLAIPSVQAVLVISLFLSLASFRAWKQRHSAWFALAHLGFLALPLAMFAGYLPCGMDLQSAFSSWCSLLLTKGIIVLLLAGIPSTLVLLLLVGPEMYQRLLHARRVETGDLVQTVARLSARLGIAVPRVYLSPTSKPLACSFSHLGGKIILSSGLTSALTKKEIESVILHELGHLKQGSSYARACSHILSFYSPAAWLALPADLHRVDECRADQTVVQIQRTTRYLASCKRKFHAASAL